MDIRSAVVAGLKPDLEAIRENIRAIRDRSSFPYHGVQIFTGMQGQGKTITMVRTVLEMKKKYPAAKVVTNLKLEVPWEYERFSTLEELSSVLTGINNGSDGVIYAIDEIQNYFNAVESKGIPIYIFAEISQQRKQRKVILGTSQLFLRVAKPFREQVSSVCICSCFLGLLNHVRIYDGESIEEDFGKLYGKQIKSVWYWQTEELRHSYDTYQVVFRGETKMEDQSILVDYSGRKGRSRRK